MSVGRRRLFVGLVQNNPARTPASDDAAFSFPAAGKPWILVSMPPRFDGHGRSGGGDGHAAKYCLSGARKVKPTDPGLTSTGPQTPFIGIFSQTLEPYGGTLGQLTFPIILAVGFWRKGQALSCAGAVIWFFENWLNIARYMADAHRLELPLVGGGDHDWNTILTRWDILQYDTRIATALKTIGWLGMVGACVWVGWRAWRDRPRAIETTN